MDLAKHGVAVFEERLILDAQPGIDDTTLARIAQRCAGPIPPALVDLWRVSFGGTLDYELHASFDGRDVALAFSELFYPGSPGYRDLLAWMEYEEERGRQAGEKRGKPWSGLQYLPFGGYETDERLYVELEPGPRYGSVHAWYAGYGSDYGTSISARVADDVRGLFRMLDLSQDPRTAAAEDYARGVKMLEKAAEIEAAGHPYAAGQVRTLVASAVLDWPTALANKTIVDLPRLRLLALKHAAATDDTQLLAELLAQGCDLTDAVGVGTRAGTVLDLALSSNATLVTRMLLDRGLPVTNAIRSAAFHLSPDLTRELLKRGAEPDANAALRAVGEGHIDAALEVAAALQEDDADAIAQLSEIAREWGERADEHAVAPPVGGTVAKYRERAEHFRYFIRRLRQR